MHYLHLHRWLSLVALLGLLAAVLGPVPSVPAAETTRLYLPLLGSRTTGSGFGIEMLQLNSERGLDLVVTSGTRWVRRNGLLWKDIEPTQGAAYRWDAPAVLELEQEMLRASQNGLNLILIVRGSPDWATAPYSAGCGPINPRHYADFARFMAALVERYSKPPYNVHYWEIGNEPDAPVRADDFVFGCWGIESDTYYGGRAYGAMLKQVGPAMKAANPAISILNGGLLLDRPYEAGRSTTSHGRFFEGMLEAGAGPWVDIVSFHSYVFYSTPGQPLLGPAQDWRVPYLRELVHRYGLAEKPLIRTEAALLCVVVNPECRWAQADLVGRTYVRSLRDGLLASVWYVYDNDSYHNTALIEPSDVFVPRPAYFAYRTAANLLSGAQYAGQIADTPPNVEAHLLRRGSEYVIAVWADQPQSARVPLPPGSQVTCIDRDGGPLACVVENGVSTLEVQTGASYIVVRP